MISCMTDLLHPCLRHRQSLLLVWRSCAKTLPAVLPFADSASVRREQELTAEFEAENPDFQGPRTPAPDHKLEIRSVRAFPKSQNPEVWEIRLRLDFQKQPELAQSAETSKLGLLVQRLMDSAAKLRSPAVNSEVEEKDNGTEHTFREAWQVCVEASNSLQNPSKLRYMERQKIFAERGQGTMR